MPGSFLATTEATLERLVFKVSFIKVYVVATYEYLAGPASSKMKMSHLILITQLETIIMSLNYILMKIFLLYCQLAIFLFSFCCFTV